MDKKQLSQSDICDKFIRPAMERAGWHGLEQILRKYSPSKTPRYDQLSAINRTVEAIAAGRQRVLLVMATGTGKTYTAFQII